jgi:hypothetical protein
MNPAQVAVVLSQMVSLLNAGLVLSANSQKYRYMVANAVKEGRDLSPEELESLRNDAQTAVDKL